MTPNQTRELTQTFYKYFTWSVGLALLVTTLLFASEIKQYAGLLKHTVYVESPIHKELSNSLSILSEEMRSLALSTDQDTIDFIRKFVHENSIHLVDSAHNAYAWHTPKMINWMVKHATNAVSEKPHMSCGSRSKAVSDLLTHFKFKNRIIKVYSSQFETLQGHVFNEVYIQGAYQIIDSDYNIHYIDSNNNRMGIADLFKTKDTNFIIPISCCSLYGWKKTNALALVQYFNCIEVNKTVLINKEHFLLRKQFQSADTTLTPFQLFTDNKFEIVEF